MKIIDPKQLKKEDLPQIVCTDDLRGFFSWLTKAHTKGNYNHIMVMHRPGYFASQTFKGYKEVPIEEYLKSRYILKFFKYKDLSPKKRKKWLELIRESLNEPWYKRRYDFIGLIGQLTGLRWINNPRTRFCSERVSIGLRRVFKMIIKLHPNPVELNKILSKDDNWESSYYMEV